MAGPPIAAFHPAPSSATGIGAPPSQPGLSVRLRASAKHSVRALGLVWQSAPGGVVALGLFTIAAAGLPPFVAYVGKLIIDGVMEARAGAPGIAREAALWHAVRLVALELGAVVLMAGCERVLTLVRQLVGLRLGIDLNVRILEKARHLELRHFEDSEFYDKLTRARREASTRPLSLIQSNFQVVRNGLTLAGYVALLTGFSGWMALAVLVATVPAFVSEARFSGAAFRLRNWRSPDSRRLTYIEYVLANDEHAKEVKLFGLGPLLLDRYKQLAESFFAGDRRLAVGRATWGYALSLVSTAVFYGCYAIIVMATVRGRLSLGDMTLYLVAFRQGQQSFQAVLSALGGMYEDTLYMSNLFDYFEIPTADEGVAGGAVAAPSSSRETLPEGGRGAAAQEAAPTTPPTELGIRFESVGFRYPVNRQAAAGTGAGAGRAPGKSPAAGAATERWALRGIDVFIPKGQSLALVGENGAGKTTFIKLLTNLYQPTEGRILLDGRDLRTWDESALRRRIGVIFQDFNQYQLALRENVAFGSVEHLNDEPAGGAGHRAGGRQRAGGGPDGRARHAARPLVQRGRRAVGGAVAEGGPGARLHARRGRHPGARRAHRRARRRGRARRVPALPGARRRPHHHPHLSPVPDGAHGRSHPGPGSRPGPGRRHPRPAPRREWTLRPPLRAAGVRISLRWSPRGPGRPCSKCAHGAQRRRPEPAVPAGTAAMGAPFGRGAEFSRRAATRPAGC
jgi:ATP-binding cassette subfamily B protein